MKMIHRIIASISAVAGVAIALGQVPTQAPAPTIHIQLIDGRTFDAASIEIKNYRLCMVSPGQSAGKTVMLEDVESLKIDLSPWADDLAVLRESAGRIAALEAENADLKAKLQVATAFVPMPLPSGRAYKDSGSPAHAVMMTENDLDRRARARDKARATAKAAPVYVGVPYVLPPILGGYGYGDGYPCDGFELNDIKNKVSDLKREAEDQKRELEDQKRAIEDQNR